MAQAPTAGGDLPVMLPVTLQRLGDGDIRGALGRALALLVANQPDDAGEIFSEVLRHPHADSRSAAIAEFGLVLVDGLTAVRRRDESLDPARIEKVAGVVERCGLGWLARMTRASLALTTQADGCEAARAVREDCSRDSDPWGAALAMLLEGLGLRATRRRRQCGVRPGRSGVRRSRCDRNG